MNSQSLTAASQSVSQINNLLIKEFSNRDTTLIGDVDLDTATLSELKEGLRLLLIRSFDYYSQAYMESLAYLLVDIAQSDYSGNFWSLVAEDFFEFDQTKRQLVKTLFQETCLRYDMPLFEEDSKSGYRIITPIICHAGIPNEQLYSFFKTVEENITGYESILPYAIDDVFRYSYISVRRFVQYLDDDYSTFITQWLLVSESSGSDSSEDDLNRLLRETFPSEKIIVPYRFLTKYIEWLNLPVDIKKGSTVKRTRFNKPSIHVDSRGIGLIMELPQQTVDPGSDYYMSGKEKLHWMINIGEHRITETCSLYYNKNTNKWFSEDRSLVLKESMFDAIFAKEIEIEVFLDDASHSLYKATIPFLNKGYLLFNNQGVYQTQYLQLSHLLIMLPCTMEADAKQIEPLPNIPYWPSYRLFNIMLRQDEELKIYERGSRTEKSSILYQGRPTPELFQGNNLFENKNIYMELPQLAIPGSISSNRDIVITNIWDREKTYLIKLSEQVATISLKNYLEEEDYGKYEIRYLEDNKTKSREIFYYVPEIVLRPINNFWPDPVEGYKTNTYEFEMPEFINIALDQHEESSNRLRDMNRRITFISGKSVTKVRGVIELEVSARKHYVPFEMSARPLVWALTSQEEDPFIPTDKVIREDWSHFKKLGEPYIVVHTGDLGAPQLDCKISVQRTDGAEIMAREYTLPSNGSLAFPLSDIRAAAESTNNKRFKVVLSINDPAGSNIGGFPLFISQDAIEVNFFTATQEDEFVYIEWEEKGSLSDRVLIAQNISAPWTDDKIFNLLDGQCSHRLQSYIFNDGYYTFKIEAPPDESPFSKMFYKPKVFASKRIFAVEGHSLNASELVQWLNDDALTYLLNVNEEDFPDPADYCLEDQNDIIYFSKSYLSIRKSKLELHSDNPIYKEFEKVEDLYQQVARESELPVAGILKTLLEENFSSDQLSQLLALFNMIWLRDEECDELSGSVYFQKLRQVVPELAFQIAISTNSHLDWVERWIGPRDLRDLLQLDVEKNAVEVLSGRLDNTAVQTSLWADNGDYWPSFEEFCAYLEHYRETITRGRGKNKSQKQILDEYEQANYASSKRLFGLTSLRLLQKIQHVAKDKSIDEEVKDLSDSMLHYVDKNLLPFSKDLAKIYPEAYNYIYLMKSYDDDEIIDLSYSIFTIMLFAVLYRHGKWKSSTSLILKYVAKIQHYFPSLYRHTLVLFEIYQLNGEANL